MRIKEGNKTLKTRKNSVKKVPSSPAIKKKNNSFKDVREFGYGISYSVIYYQLLFSNGNIMTTLTLRFERVQLVGRRPSISAAVAVRWVDNMLATWSQKKKTIT